MNHYKMSRPASILFRSNRDQKGSTSLLLGAAGCGMVWSLLGKERVVSVSWSG